MEKMLIILRKFFVYHLHIENNVTSVFFDVYITVVAYRLYEHFVHLIAFVLLENRIHAMIFVFVYVWYLCDCVTSAIQCIEYFSAMEDRRNENPVAKEPEPSVDQPDNMHKHIEVTEEKNELDDKAVISHLKRSNSVSMKASLFSKWQNEGKKATEELKSRKKDGKFSFI